MAKFTFEISRSYTITEGMTRTYEAETQEDAQAMADSEASESNDDCPDDCSEIESGNSETGDFSARLLHPWETKE